MIINFKNQNGQVMLVTVMTLTGTVLAATTIAGLLMLYQIRNSADIINSSKAIYAADSGIEFELYKLFKPDDEIDDFNELSNGAKFSTSIDVDETSEIIIIKSTGRSNKIARAFEMTLSKEGSE